MCSLQGHTKNLHRLESKISRSFGLTIKVCWQCFSIRFGAYTTDTTDDVVGRSETTQQAKKRARDAELRANDAEVLARQVFAREAASIQLQDALDRASTSETRAREAEAMLATERTRYLDADLRARSAEAEARDTQSQLTLQTQGTSTPFTGKHSHPRLTNVSQIPQPVTARTELEQRLNRIEESLIRARDEIHEQRFMSAACRRADEFQVSRRLGYGDQGMVALVTCTTPGFMWPTKQYALKVCFNFDLNTSQARGAYINEFIELVKLPSHPNIVRFLCEFVDEIHDNIRPHLPDFARERAIITQRDGTQTNRKTQFFVLEHVEMSLKQLLESRFSPPSIVPHRMVATIISQVGSGLRHLDRHRLAHRDVKPDNIMVETRINSSTNEIEITRCVLIDFGTSCRLNDQMQDSILVSDTGKLLGFLWGNQPHIAPELRSAVGSATVTAMRAKKETRVELDYSRQSVFELGVLAFEIVNGCHPIEEYSGSILSQSTGRIEYGDDDIARISADRLGSEQASMLRRAVSCDASRRPSLDELIRCFDPEGDLGVDNIV